MEWQSFAKQLFKFNIIFSIIFSNDTEKICRPLWLTYYSPLVKSSEGGRLLSDKRTQVLEVGDLGLDLDSGITIGNLENLQLFPRN